jgi:hypothetical protein
MLEAGALVGKLIDSHLPYPDRSDAAPGQGGTLDAGKYRAALRHPAVFPRVFCPRAPVGSAVADLLWQGSGDGSARPDATFELAFRQKLVSMH